MFAWICDNTTFKTYDDASAHAARLHAESGVYAGIEHAEVFGPAFVHKAFGPEYPGELSKDVANFRKLARHGLSELSRMSRRGYGNAVLTAILVKQKQALQRELPSHNIRCASGTNHTAGKDILKAVAAQNRAACLAKGDFDQAEANAKYEEAMKAKHRSAELRQAA